MDKESFVFHRDFMDELWDDPEERLKWYDRIFLYALDNKEPDINDRNERKAWGNIKSHIDSDRESWERKIEYQKQYKERMKQKNKEVSEVSKVSENKSEKKNIPPNSPYESESEFVSEFESESVFEFESVSEFEREGNKSSPARAKQPFVAPTLEQVQEYCTQMGYTLDAGAFIDHYTANGWKQSRGKPIEDWKAAVRNWNRREKDFAPKTEESFDSKSSVNYSSEEWQQEEW